MLLAAFRLRQKPSPNEPSASRPSVPGSGVAKLTLKLAVLSVTDAVVTPSDAAVAQSGEEDDL